MYPCWDQLAMAAAILPEVVTEVREVYVTIETQGSLTRGQMVVDPRGKLGKSPNVKIIKEINNNLYKKCILNNVFN